MQAPPGCQDEKMIRRARQIVNVSVHPEPRYTAQDGIASIPSSYKKIRKSQSMYSTGSPMRLSQESPQDRIRVAKLDTPRSAHHDGYGGNLSHLSQFGPSSTPVTESPKLSIRENQTEDEIVAMARDRYLQDSYTRTVRERKSFVLNPLKKRRDRVTEPSSVVTYDTSLPPFNYAGDNRYAPRTPATLPDAPLAPPAPPPLPPPPVPPNVLKKPRKVSDPFKRIRSLFRKSSKAHPGLPAQHVEATQMHFDVHPLAYTSTTTNSADTLDNDAAECGRPRLPSETMPLTATRTVSPYSIHNHAGGSVTTRSRVTSWSNSTATNTVRTLGGDKHLPSITEYSAQPNSPNPRHASFLGRTLHIPARRQSRSDLSHGSEDSQRLYSALMKQMSELDTKDTASLEGVIDGSAAPPVSVFESLPSRRRASSVISKISRLAKNTIRSVTPDPPIHVSDDGTYDHGSKRVVSRRRGSTPPARPPRPDVDIAGNSPPSSPPTGLDVPRTRLQWNMESMISVPSQQRISQLVEKPKNRWQDTLYGMSAVLPHSTQASRFHDNPYELHLVSAVANVDNTPEHTLVLASGGEPVEARREAVPARSTALSPSIYSRATDCQSPRPDTPVDDGGMSVTITGREVKRYSIGPPLTVDEPYAHNRLTSEDWRAWLSSELTDFDNTPAAEDLTITTNDCTNATIDRQRELSPELPEASDLLRYSRQSQHDGDEYHGEPEKDDSQIIPTIHLPKSRRPKLEERSSSSQMNERFPWIDTGRKASDKGPKCARKVSPKEPSSSERATSSPLDSEAATGQFSGGHPEKEKPRHMLDRRRPIARPRSLAQFTSAVLDEPKLAPQKERSSPTDIVKTVSIITTSVAHNDQDAIAPSSAQPYKTYRTKSAFNLRACYRSPNNTNSAISIRRRPIIASDLKDTTLRNISSGPYALNQHMPVVKDKLVCRTANKENTAPPAKNMTVFDTNAEEVGRKVYELDSPVPSVEYSALAKPSPSHVSRYPSPEVLFGKYSPGQRMADDFLIARRKERFESPASGKGAFL
ncbi:hypothetical protein LTR28_003462 [Elasticomyces elasticus]|nr:hypothetical protein LTR28_003462 [Elasticomyces elasticus]